MAVPLVVQTKTADNNTSQTTLAAVFTNNNKAGNMIVVVCNTDLNDTISTPTDTLGNTYTQIYNVSVGATKPVAAAWYALNIKSGANTVTGHFGGANNEVTMIIREYSGVLSFDTSKTANNTSGSSTAINSGNTTATGSPYRLVIAIGHEGFGSGQTWSVGTGFINLTTDSNNSSEGCAIADMIVGTSGATSATFTLGSGANWLGAVVTFIPTGGSFQPNKLRPHIFSPGIAR